MTTPINLAGDLVALGPLRRDLMPTYCGWLNDWEVGLGFFRGELVADTLEATERRYDRIEQDERRVTFTIYERATMRPIGTTGLSEISWPNRSASFGISVGERDCWGRGYGTEATRLVLAYAFDLLGLHTVLLTVFDFNQRAIRAYRRAGFREVGRWREAKQIGGQRYDVVYMECLGREFARPASTTLPTVGGEG